MEKQMDLAFFGTLMETSMKENGSMIKLTETVHILMRTVLHMLVNGRMISSMVLVKSSGLMELFMRGDTPWELNMEKEYCSLGMAQSMKEISP